MTGLNSFVGWMARRRPCGVSHGDGREGNIAGEIFGGVDVAVDGNDASALLAQLREAAEAAEAPGQPGQPGEARELAGTVGPDPNPNAVVQLVSHIRGPWALVYWHSPTRRLWWGRDAIGRRR